MEYFIICLAVVCFTGQFAFTKIFEKLVKSSFISTLVMLIVTSIFGALIFLIVGGFKVEFSLFSFILAIIFAIIMIPYYLIGVKVLSLGSLAVYSVFMMLGGMLVPFFYGVIFLSEQITISKIIGTVLLTTFIILQGVSQEKNATPVKEENRLINKNKKRLFFILCLVIFFINGLTGVIAKAHEIGPNPINEASFSTLYCALTALFSFIALIIVMVKNRKTNPTSLKPVLKLKPIITMLLIGATAHTGNFLHLLVAEKVPASVQFPLVSGGVIVLSAIASRVIFKEKITKVEWLSVLGAFIATVLFAF